MRPQVRSKVDVLSARLAARNSRRTVLNSADRTPDSALETKGHGFHGRAQTSTEAVVVGSTPVLRCEPQTTPERWTLANIRNTPESVSAALPAFGRQSMSIRAEPQAGRTVASVCGSPRVLITGAHAPRGCRVRPCLSVSVTPCSNFRLLSAVTNPRHAVLSLPAAIIQRCRPRSGPPPRPALPARE